MNKAARQTAINFHNQAANLEQSDPQVAFKLLVSATEADPTFPDSWRSLGDVNFNLSLRQGAIANYRRYLELMPEDGRAMVSLGHQLYHEGKIEEAERWTRRALKIDDKLANGWTNLSLIDSLYARIGDSLDHAKLGWRLEPNPTTELAYAFALLHARKLDLGLSHFEAKIPAKQTQVLGFPWPQWRGEDLVDKTLFVLADQGMGDTLDFIRFIPIASRRCAKIVFHIQQEMIRLAQVMLVDYGNVELVPLNSAYPAADMWIGITSLPVALKLTSDEIQHCPQLPIPPIPMPSNWKMATRKLHVGICWAGNPGNDIDRWRSMKLEQFLEFNVPNVQLYSLQFDGKTQEVHAAGAAAVVKDLTGWGRDSLAVAGLIQQLDLVICIESYIGHMCAALRVPYLMPYGWCGGDYRVGRKGQRTMWHDTGTIFYQWATQDWANVVADIREALIERASH